MLRISVFFWVGDGRNKFFSGVSDLRLRSCGRHMCTSNLDPTAGPQPELQSPAGKRCLGTQIRHPRKKFIPAIPHPKKHRNPEHFATNASSATLSPPAPLPKIRVKQTLLPYKE